jgi:hypothetical protein
MQLPSEPIKNNKNFMNRYYMLQYIESLPMLIRLNVNDSELVNQLKSYAKKQNKEYKQLAYNLKKPMTTTRLKLLSRIKPPIPTRRRQLARLKPSNMKYAGEISEYKLNKLGLNMRRPNFKNVGTNQNILRNNAARKIQKAVRHSIKRRNNTFLSGLGGKTFNEGGQAKSLPENILKRIIKQARS